MPTFRFPRIGLPLLLCLAALGSMGGCGGSGGGGGDSAFASPAILPMSTDKSSTPTAETTGAGNVAGGALALPPSSPLTGSTTLRVRSPSGGAALPFTAGYAFKQGDIPSGRFVAASASGLRSFQASVKNRWRDGSVKFAVLSGQIDLTANAEQSLSIGPTAADPEGAALGLADLKATGAAASISYGSYGTVTWTGNDWDAPFLSPASGTVMSSWVYRRPIGSDEHLVAWIEVRLYRGGAVEIVPWIENGYLLRAAPGERSGTAIFALNGSERFSGELLLRNHTRAVLASGQTLSHWLGSDPGITFRHDMGYLQMTGLVPAYRGVTAASSRIFNRVSSSYTPLGQHDFPNGMGSPGFHPSIGPLPEWDVVYMTSNGDTRAWRSVQIHGYAAGRYGIHFRDETTNRAARLTSYPKLVLRGGSGIMGTGASTINQYTPATTGGSPPGFTSSHMPAIGYMAYLVTGRWYFLDEMQLLSSTVLLKQTDSVRHGTDGLILSSAGANTTRGAAWTLRALAHTAALTPDDDPLKAEFTASIQHNIDWHHARYVAQANNPLGLVQPYSDYTPTDGKIDSAAWMEDFLTWAFGNIKSVQAYDATYDVKVDEFLAWKYRAIVGRLGPNETGSWSYRQAAVYTMPYAPSRTVDWAGGTGPWYANWGDAYAAAGLSYSAGNTLVGSYIEGSGLADSYWGNLQPAIAYAVEHGAPGAMSAYNRMVTAGNWQSAARHFDSATPVWSVRPRNVGY